MGQPRRGGKGQGNSTAAGSPCASLLGPPGPPDLQPARWTLRVAAYPGSSRGPLRLSLCPTGPLCPLQAHPRHPWCCSARQGHLAPSEAWPRGLWAQLKGGPSSSIVPLESRVNPCVRQASADIRQLPLHSVPVRSRAGRSARSPLLLGLPSCPPAPMWEVGNLRAWLPRTSELVSPA